MFFARGRFLHNTIIKDFRFFSISNPNKSKNKKYLQIFRKKAKFF